MSYVLCLMSSFFVLASDSGIGQVDGVGKVDVLFLARCRFFLSLL